MRRYNRRMAASPSPSPFLQPAYDHKRYFLDTLGLSERLLERCLGEALSAGGDFADLYFKSVPASIVCGVRIAIEEFFGTNVFERMVKLTFLGEYVVEGVDMRFDGCS